MKIMKGVFVLSLIIVSSCDTHIELTRESKTVRRYVDQSICTKEDMLLYQWNSKYVDHFDQNEYVLYSANKDELERYFDGSLLARYDNGVKSTLLIPQGAVLEVKTIFYYYKQLCCTGYDIMATLNGNKVDGKLINVSTLFKRSPIGPENPPEEGLDIAEARLIDEYAVLCSDPEP